MGRGSLSRWVGIGLVLGAMLVVGWPLIAPAAKTPDVRASKHNFSPTATGKTGAPPARDVVAVSETQVCVYCHTPHAATGGVTPLWNRRLSGASYTPYTSSSFDAQRIVAEFDSTPGGSSKLCLSCHDGTMAIGNVNVLNGQMDLTAGIDIPMTITGGGTTIPPGSGADTGFTRNLGTDLRNDHPISVTYTNTLVTRDGDLRDVNASQQDIQTGGQILGIRASGYKPHAPLEKNTDSLSPAYDKGQVQCASCHDPHVIETDTANNGNNKFLRTNLNRFQKNISPAGNGDFTVANDIICIGCHRKEGWPQSAHANNTVATQTYTAAAVSLREFPTAPAFQMWNAACLNCHDTHTVSGSVRLLREGTDSITSPKQGGNRAIEETCFQCHRATGSAISGLPGRLDVYVDFTATGTLNANTQRVQTASHMPIAANPEVHDIGGNLNEPAPGLNCTTANNRCGKDFVESRTLLGYDPSTSSSVPANRHAECTDCHNPHRVLRNSRYDGTGITTQTTHEHPAGGAVMHTNAASGALAGTFGVEITGWTSAAFGDAPSAFTPLCGNPGSGGTAACSAGQVTKEYQVCLKCHSNYAYADVANGSSSTATFNYVGRLQMGGTGATQFVAVTGYTGAGINPAFASNGTPQDFLHMSGDRYTNQGMEFQAPSTHKGELNGTGPEPVAINHRSWHPVIDSTGRTLAERGNAATSLWLAPWNNGAGGAGTGGYVGQQTMYCTDCHGNNVATASTVVPDTGKPWGPHGSVNNFILKAPYNGQTGEGQTADLCFKCHNASTYATTNEGTRSGFSGNQSTNLHGLHGNKIDTNMKCTFCHVALPHGWKNKAFLVNLNDVGPEVGLAAGTSVTYTNNKGYTKGPYYLNAFLRVTTWKRSGNWVDSDCNGGKDGMRTNCETPQ
ncbi:MAG: cytochrome c3 family protein [Betaproteobacteria bacterium]|nr:cytochrome c3 family protein [Betaproteobacteria bacterium]